jgi:hypothetical protein
MSDWRLDTLSVKELRELRDRVDAAIRAVISRDRVEREAVRLPGATTQPVIDLEKERDAWTASRKRI